MTYVQFFYCSQLVFPANSDLEAGRVEFREVLLDQPRYENSKSGFIVDKQNGFSMEKPKDIAMPAVEASSPSGLGYWLGFQFFDELLRTTYVGHGAILPN